jgi:hypothetical protein
MRLVLVLLIAGCATDGAECKEGVPATGETVAEGQCLKAIAYQANEVLGIEADPDACSPDPEWCAVGMPGEIFDSQGWNSLRFDVARAPLNADGSCPLSCN